MSEHVAKLETIQSVPPPTNEGAVVLAMIDKLIARPDVPVEKLEQMFALHQKVQADHARRAYDEAFPAMSAELPEIDKRGKIIIKEKGTEKIIQTTPYALWDDTNRMIKPVLAKHGFGLSFRITQTDAKITTTAVLSHVAGHREETSFSATIDSTGSKNNVQGWGSSFAYGKRYTGTAILNITTRGEDDDGAKAGETSGHATVETISALIKESASSLTWFLEHYSVETIDDLNGKQRDEIKSKLTAKLARMRRAHANG
jgi:hypothetical protein